MSRVIDAVSRHPAGVGAAQVAAMTDLPRSKVDVYLSRAVESERLHRPARGTYAPIPSNPLLEVSDC